MKMLQRLVLLVAIAALMAASGCFKAPSNREIYTKAFADLRESDSTLQSIVMFSMEYHGELRTSSTCPKDMLPAIKTYERDPAWTMAKAGKAFWRAFIFEGSLMGENLKYRQADTIATDKVVVPWIDEESRLHFALVPAEIAKERRYTKDLNLLDLQENSEN